MKYFWCILSVILFTSIFVNRDYNSRYEQPINGDAKGYYAYLPALFIHHDLSYDFIDEVEAKYYPEDGSHFKDFKVAQANGTFVNKCFPGLSILYAPFFFLAYFLSYILGFPLDGYSVLFQVLFSCAHVVYFLLGLRLFQKSMSFLSVSKSMQYLTMILLTFGTNCWFYTVVDHTVAHIFLFFLVNLFVYRFLKWTKSKSPNDIAFSGVVLVLMCIIRPTNALIVLFIPFLVILSKQSFSQLISFKAIVAFKSIWIYMIAVLLVLFTVGLWKLQSGSWFVYSYGNEGFDFGNPEWLNFLFSFKKGWFLWTPIFSIVFTIIGFGLVYDFKKSLAVLLPFLMLVYVFSSWWCWTFGTGMGQRPLIEYYPFAFIGFVCFYGELKWRKVVLGLMFITVPLNLLQAFQFSTGIHVGAETSRVDYCNRFLQIRKSPPTVNIPNEWILMDTKEVNRPHKIDENEAFSESITTNSLKAFNHMLIEFTGEGEHHDENYTLVIASNDGTYYKSIYLGEVIYQKSRTYQYLVEIEDCTIPYKIYFWNGGTAAELKIDQLIVKCYCGD